MAVDNPKAEMDESAAPAVQGRIMAPAKAGVAAPQQLLERIQSGEELLSASMPLTHLLGVPRQHAKSMSEKQVRFTTQKNDLKEKVKEQEKRFRRQQEELADLLWREKAWHISWNSNDGKLMVLKDAAILGLSRLNGSLSEAVTRWKKAVQDGSVNADKTELARFKDIEEDACEFDSDSFDEDEPFQQANSILDMGPLESSATMATMQTGVTPQSPSGSPMLVRFDSSTTAEEKSRRRAQRWEDRLRVCAARAEQVDARLELARWRLEEARFDPEDILERNRWRRIAGVGMVQDIADSAKVRIWEQEFLSKVHALHKCERQHKKKLFQLDQLNDMLSRKGSRVLLRAATTSLEKQKRAYERRRATKMSQVTETIGDVGELTECRINTRLVVVTDCQLWKSMDWFVVARWLEQGEHLKALSDPEVNKAGWVSVVVQGYDEVPGYIEVMSEQRQTVRVARAFDREGVGKNLHEAVQKMPEQCQSLPMEIAEGTVMVFVSQEEDLETAQRQVAKVYDTMEGWEPAKEVPTIAWGEIAVASGQAQEVDAPGVMFPIKYPDKGWTYMFGWEKLTLEWLENNEKAMQAIWADRLQEAKAKIDKIKQERDEDLERKQISQDFQLNIQSVPTLSIEGDYAQEVFDRRIEMEKEYQELNLGQKKLRATQHAGFLDVFNQAMKHNVRAQAAGTFDNKVETAVNAGFYPEFSRLAVYTGPRVTEEIRALQIARRRANERDGYRGFHARRAGEEECPTCCTPFHVGISCELNLKMLQRQEKVQTRVSARRSTKKLGGDGNSTENMVEKLESNTTPMSETTIDSADADCDLLRDSDDESEDVSGGSDDETPVTITVRNHKGHTPTGPAVFISVPYNSKVKAVREALAQKLCESLVHIILFPSMKGMPFMKIRNDANIRHIGGFPLLIMGPAVDISKTLAESENPEDELRSSIVTRALTKATLVGQQKSSASSAPAVSPAVSSRSRRSAGPRSAAPSVADSMADNMAPSESKVSEAGGYIKGMESISSLDSGITNLMSGVFSVSGAPEGELAEAQGPTRTARSPAQSPRLSRLSVPGARMSHPSNQISGSPFSTQSAQQSSAAPAATEHQSVTKASSASAASGKASPNAHEKLLLQSLDSFCKIKSDTSAPADAEDDVERVISASAPVASVSRGFSEPVPGKLANLKSWLGEDLSADLDLHPTKNAGKTAPRQPSPRQLPTEPPQLQPPSSPGWRAMLGGWFGLGKSRESGMMPSASVPVSSTSRTTMAAGRKLNQGGEEQRIDQLIRDVYKRKNPDKQLQVEMILFKFRGESKVNFYRKVCAKYGESPREDVGEGSRQRGRTDSMLRELEKVDEAPAGQLDPEPEDDVERVISASAPVAAVTRGFSESEQPLMSIDSWLAASEVDEKATAASAGKAQEEPKAVSVASVSVASVSVASLAIPDLDPDAPDIVGLDSMEEDSDGAEQPDLPCGYNSARTSVSVVEYSQDLMGSVFSGLSNRTRVRTEGPQDMLKPEQHYIKYT